MKVSRQVKKWALGGQLGKYVGWKVSGQVVNRQVPMKESKYVLKELVPMQEIKQIVSGQIERQ